ncbi:hypothetical protein AYO21_09749 [Fonsecaea monophora]|uniref:Uncharacterized protein n=1 Tax=Fonsecaea monophora TaxID=254056 RepID=A0A177EXC6_9EURO|nr:hypothetical protein AYO21_09749 [Fonsecaea monophora]KAH0829409.1 hypothetical protein FOPE_10879 [Fonsecaea pedrosoi]OAG36031.1 hypothetical protein AYO21_09749 [Fonsecaea monophora]
MLKGRRGAAAAAADTTKSDPPVVVTAYYEQYKTENIQTVFRDYFPSEESSQEERDVLLEKRVEISRKAERLQADKRAFSAANQQASKERLGQGVRCYDWAYAVQDESKDADEKE